MSESIAVIEQLEQFMNHQPELVTWSVALFILFICIISQKSFISEFITEYKLNRLIKNLGRESLHNVVIPDGMDSKVYIEHLILTSEGILLLSVKRYRGTIFAADSIDYWTQVVGKKSYKFENPLHQLENDVLALSSYIKNTRLSSKVLFINGSSFPKGKPDSVISVQEVKAQAREYSAGEIPDHVRTDWQRLHELAQADDVAGDDVLIDDNTSSAINVFALLTCSAFMALWLVIRFS